MATDIQISSTPAISRIGDGLRALVPSVPLAVPAGRAAQPPAFVPEPPLNLARALEEIAAHAADAGAAVDFQVDDDSGRVIVRVIDRSDGTVLRQMPSEEALRIARALANSEGHLIDGLA